MTAAVEGAGKMVAHNGLIQRHQRRLALGTDMQRQRFFVGLFGPVPAIRFSPFSVSSNSALAAVPSGVSKPVPGVVAQRCCVANLLRSPRKQSGFQKRLRSIPGLSSEAGFFSLGAATAAVVVAMESGGSGTAACSRTGSENVETVTEAVQALTVEEKKPDTLRTELYPPIEPYKTGFLKVSEIHTLYWEESGNPEGVPVVFLHGGPGSGTSPSNRRFFDPDFYRIVLLDQRGSGKSTPHACLVDNTTWHLVDDIERVREHLGIDKWQVFGGSWGSTLSLTYAQVHPDRVTALVLRGIFMVRKKELDWFYRTGGETIYPDAWEAYKGAIPEEEHGDLIAAYNRRLMDDEHPDAQMAAARAWTAWEMATSYLLQNAESLKRTENDRFALAFARIENHYFFNNGFFESDSYILDNIPKIRHIPAVIIQGRYDIVCPMMSAWDLHRSWPEAALHIVPDAGHSCNEPGIGARLVEANERFKTLYKV